MGGALPTTSCKRCDRPIIWRKSTETGAEIPLDAMRGQVYLCGVGDRACTPVEDAYVTHLATCPHATAFGKGRKPPPASTAEQAGDRNKLANAVLALVKSDPYVDAELDCTRVVLIECAIEAARCS